MTTFVTPVEQTLASFDWQWDNLPSGDFMPGDPWFDANASRLLALELCAIAPDWFRGKRVLDAGCGRGRWTRALLDLGAHVTAIDFSDAGLARTRALCGDSPRLVTRRANLLDLPSDLAQERFDLVYSFGVLHHTGETWRALDNVASLVARDGAIFLYLYGATAWGDEGRARVEALRRELADVPFDEKLRELSRRFPNDDPHQLFDLLGPVINDRVNFDEVERRLAAKGFDHVTQTVESPEVYLRGSRPGFSSHALLQPVGGASAFVAEVDRRGLIRRGVTAEEAMRAAVRDVPRRPVPMAIREAINSVASRGSSLDLGFPPDRVVDGSSPWVGPAMSTPRLVPATRAELVVWCGATLGAGRFPREALGGAWAHVASGGRLLCELPDSSFGSRRRSALDRVLGYREGVPLKLARLLRAHGEWSAGEALFALGGAVLVNPIPESSAAATLRELGAESVTASPCRAGTVLLTAVRPAVAS